MKKLSVDETTLCAANKDALGIPPSIIHTHTHTHVSILLLAEAAFLEAPEEKCCSQIGSVTTRGLHTHHPHVSV